MGLQQERVEHPLEMGSVGEVGLQQTAVAAHHRATASADVADLMMLLLVSVTALSTQCPQVARALTLVQSYSLMRTRYCLQWWVQLQLLEQTLLLQAYEPRTTFDRYWVWR